MEITRILLGLGWKMYGLWIFQPSPTQNKNLRSHKWCSWCKTSLMWPQVLLLHWNVVFFLVYFFFHAYIITQITVYCNNSNVADIIQFEFIYYKNVTDLRKNINLLFNRRKNCESCTVINFLKFSCGFFSISA